MARDDTAPAQKAKPPETGTLRAKLAAALGGGVLRPPAADAKAVAAGDSKLARRDAFERAAIDWTRSPFHRARMAHVHEEVAGFRITDASRLSHGEVVSLLSTVLDRHLHRLGTFTPETAVKTTPTPVSQIEAEAAKAKEPEPPPEEEPPPPRDWIEFQFVDMNDKPVSGVRYKVKLPNGKEVEGKTASKGLIHFDDLDSGQCEVTLMEFDEKAWEKA